MSDLRTDLPPHDGSGLAMRLPQGSIDEIPGLLKILARVAFAQRVSLADLSDTVRYDQEKLLNLLKRLGILGFAEVSVGAVRLTRAGRLYARASDHERRTVFAGQLAQRIPLAAYVRDVLEAHPAHRLALTTMLVDLQQRFALADAGAAMRTVIAWARYAGFFSTTNSAACSRSSNPRSPITHHRECPRVTEAPPHDESNRHTLLGDPLVLRRRSGILADRPAAVARSRQEGQEARRGSDRDANRLPQQGSQGPDRGEC